VVDEYSGRNLTVPSDKLPALAGMAQQLGRREGGYGRYVAGLWESHLPVSLLWRVAPDGPQGTRGGGWPGAVLVVGLGGRDGIACPS
jgi:hypothetical protein